MTADEHIPQTSADPYEYEDDRGIRIADEDWECPNCGEHGRLMWRPGSKNTCATCFWVRDGQYNDYVLPDWPLDYREAQQLLAYIGEQWYGTPGDIGTRLRAHFDSRGEVFELFRRFRERSPLRSVGTDRSDSEGDASTSEVEDGD